MFESVMSMGCYGVDRVAAKRFGMDVRITSAAKLQKVARERAKAHAGIPAYIADHVEIVGVENKIDDTTIVTVNYPLMDFERRSAKEIESGIFAVLAEIELDVKRAIDAQTLIALTL